VASIRQNNRRLILPIWLCSRKKLIVDQLEVNKTEMKAKLARASGGLTLSRWAEPVDSRTGIIDLDTGKLFVPANVACYHVHMNIPSAQRIVQSQLAASAILVSFECKAVSVAASIRNNYVGEESMRRAGHKNAVRSNAEQASEAANAELIALIAHRLREPLGPTLLVLQLLLRQESLSPQGIDLIRMLQRSIREEVRAIRELLTIMQTFLEERGKQTPRAQERSLKNADNSCLGASSSREWATLNRLAGQSGK
jgi:signal transduction histidine kinase